jgi:hypothetical protein
MLPDGDGGCRGGDSMLAGGGGVKAKGGSFAWSRRWLKVKKPSVC